jgi:hypothetical protein
MERQNPLQKTREMVERINLKWQRIRRKMLKAWTPRLRV